jgi:hypothetical protein
VVTRGRDPSSTVFWDGYDFLVAKYQAMRFEDLPGGLEGYYEEFTLQTPADVIVVL